MTGTAATLPDMGPDLGDGHNVTDWFLSQVHERYGDDTITKDDVWEYLYGVMHAPDWRERYRHDLARSLPRVPLAEDFEAFRAAGRALMDLHVGYETCPEHPAVVCEVDGEPDEGSADPGAYRIAGRMRGIRADGSKCGRNDDWDALAVNDRCRLAGIPPEAHAYKVSGRSPLQWAVDQLRVKHDKPSRIVDDPNRWHAWADDPFKLIRHLRRLAWVGAETHRIVSGLPPALADDTAAPGPMTGLAQASVHPQRRGMA